MNGGRWLTALAVAALLSSTAALLVCRLSSYSPSTEQLPCCLLNGGMGGPVWQPPEQRGKKQPPVQVVVSHFNSPLAWTADLLASLPEGTKLTVYSKGPDPPKGKMA